jgi:hypothetical protein
MVCRLAGDALTASASQTAAHVSETDGGDEHTADGDTRAQHHLELRAATPIDELQEIMLEAIAPLVEVNDPGVS